LTIILPTSRLVTTSATVAWQPGPVGNGMVSRS